MTTLIEYMNICEHDTATYINKRAANRFSAWRQYENEQEVINFVQRIIRNSDNLANGFLIHSQNGVSLESIVAIHHPDLFTEDDVDIAR